VSPVEIDDLLLLWSMRLLVVGLTFLFVHLLLLVIREFRGPRREKVPDE
jgi:hypothetical protein